MKHLFLFVLIAVFGWLALPTFATPVINPDGIILPSKADTSTAYTLAITVKSGTSITMNNAAANVLTIPAEATADFPIGAYYPVQQIGAGVTTITAAAGVTLNGSVASSVVMPIQYGVLTIKKISADVWISTVFTSAGDMTIAAYDPAGITEQVVGLVATQTLTNKTLTAPVIATISNTGVVTLFTDTDTVVGKATTDTLTNKTLTAPVIDKIVFANGTSLLTGVSTTRAAVRADGGDAAAVGSQYNSTAGKIYFKVANATADTDWQLVTTTAAD